MASSSDDLLRPKVCNLPLDGFLDVPGAFEARGPLGVVGTRS